MKNSFHSCLYIDGEKDLKYINFFNFDLNLVKMNRNPDKTHDSKGLEKTSTPFESPYFSGFLSDSFSPYIVYFFILGSLKVRTFKKYKNGLY